MKFLYLLLLLILTSCSNWNYKKIEYERSQKNRKYEEESAVTDKKIANNKSLIRSFFKSKV